MAGRQLDAMVHYICRLAGVEPVGDQTDAQLLDRFIKHQDEAAFESLLHRHGPLVLSVCREILDDAHDAEDAFQATFLVLVRKARSIRKRTALRSWLYGVAYRIAVRAKAHARKRRCHERQGVDMESAQPLTPVDWQQLAPALHEELCRLPDKYRLPILLCYFEKKTYEEAAGELGWPLGTLKKRLSDARELLRTRLSRHGLTLCAGLFAAALAERVVSAAVPLRLVTSTLKAAFLVAAGKAAVAGVISGKVAALTEGMVKAMVPAKVKLAAALVLVLGLVGAGLGLAAHQALRKPQPRPEPRALLPKGQTLPENKLAKGRNGDPLPAGAVARLGSSQLAHRGNVSCAAFSPDGKILATGGFDNYVRLWDPATGRELQALQHFGSVRSLVWAPDGKTLFSSSDGEGVRIWDTPSGKELRRLGDRKGMVTSLALTRDGKTLAYAVGEKTVVVRHVPGDQELFRFQAGDRAYCLAFSRDGRTLIVGGEPKKIRRWHVPTGKELPPLEGHTGGTYPVLFSPDGKLIASGGSYLDGEIHLWDAETGKEIRRWLAHTYGVGSLAFSPDSKTLLSGHSAVRDTLRLWDVATGRALRSFPAPIHGLVDSITFAPDGKLAASAGCWGRGVYLWEVATGKEVSPFPRHNGEVTGLAFTLDGRLLATGSADHTVALWEADTGRPIGRFRGHRGPVRAVAVAPDGKLVASAGQDDKGVLLWSRETGELVRELVREKVAFTCLAFSPDGQILAAGEGADTISMPAGARAPDGAVRLWNVPTGKEIRQLRGKAGRVNALAFSPDGQTLATTGFDDLAIHLWNPQTGTERARLERTTDSGASKWLFEGTSALVFAANGRTLAALSFYEQKSNIGPAVPPKENAVRTVSLWEVATGQMCHEIRLPVNSVKSIGFVDGRYLVFGGNDATIRPLDLATNQWLPAAHGHQDSVAALALSPNGRTLASGSWDTTTLVWRTAALIAQRPLQKTKRTEHEIEALRKDLVGVDAVRAYRAMWELAATPQAVRLLERLVRPVPKVDGARLKALVAALDSDKYRVREQATAELRRLAELATPTLREVLRRPPSAEVRRRVQGLLAASGDDKRVSARTLEVLEHLDTPEGLRLLELLASGAPTARLTQEAKASRARLAKRSAVTP
ncbi:MAG TPA: LpqB family beta-propeller domain-containing protein [Gemmataceae bacterium]|jgi:RNA polymerase sigma factor (sigma-70 family)|nr:LpqB family beta-propeller domain-containing protein [Gemmataceae bacterium]